MAYRFDPPTPRGLFLCVCNFWLATFERGVPKPKKMVTSTEVLVDHHHEAVSTFSPLREGHATLSVVPFCAYVRYHTPCVKCCVTPHETHDYSL